MVGKHNSEAHSTHVRISPKITGETRKVLEEIIALRESHLEKHPEHKEEVGKILTGMFIIAKGVDPSKNEDLKKKLKELKELAHSKKGGCGCGCESSSSGKTGGCDCMGGSKMGGKRRSKRSKKSKTGGKRSAKRSQKRK
jgi:hypothetical protein